MKNLIVCMVFVGLAFINTVTYSLMCDRKPELKNKYTKGATVRTGIIVTLLSAFLVYQLVTGGLQ